MTYNQHLPNYRRDFLSDTRWLKKSSKHYLFHYLPDSEAERDIESIIVTQEAAFEKINAFLNVDAPTQPIEYFFYPDEQTKQELMGNSWYAQVVYDEFRVHVLYTKDVKPIGPHEDTHLLSLPWGLSTGFLQEGLAEYLTDQAWDGTPHQVYVREGWQRELYPPISSLMDHQNWMATDDTKLIYFYSLASTFTSFLVEQYGKKLFEKLYQQTARENSGEENSIIFQKIYSLSIDEAEKEFRRSYE